LSRESRAQAEITEDPLYLVRSPAFDGPIELLLNLAQREEVDLRVISLAALAEDYLRSLEETRPPLDRMAAFLTVGSRLVQLKARHLMPAPAVAAEEDLEAWEDAIKGRLDEYRRFKALAETIMRRHASGRFTFAGLFEPEVVPEPRVNVSLETLAQAFQQVLDRLPAQPLVTVELEQVSLGDRLESLRQMLRLHPEMNFSAVFAQASTRLEAVVTFLALLELVRIGEVLVGQSSSFSDIRVQARTPGA
jgi:segregation and condensation protein A